MIAIMEKYSKNLEEIVDERTDQLREEKRRTDELLHQMLPEWVMTYNMTSSSAAAAVYLSQSHYRRRCHRYHRVLVIFVLL